MTTQRDAVRVDRRIRSIAAARPPDRRAFLRMTAASLAGGLGALKIGASDDFPSRGKGTVRTVLGDVSPGQLGATLMHEHAPLVDWSELYENPPAPITAQREKMLTKTAGLLDRFHKTLQQADGPGAIVECTPIRVGRYPRLLVELAKRTKIHIIACTGFWCEAFAPQHPWAARLATEKRGVHKIAKLYLREIVEGMEDPTGDWGEKFTSIRAGIIKCATSQFMRPSERRCHEAAAISSRETGCPITTHTTDGGGLEQARLFIRHGADPERIIIGHQGHLDDREHDEAHEYHRRIAALGCHIQFDRVGHAEKYANVKLARQIKSLIDSGHVKQVLLGHDHVPYFFEDYAGPRQKPKGWKVTESDYTVVTTGLAKKMAAAGVTPAEFRVITVDNPKRVLAF